MHEAFEVVPCNLCGKNETRTLYASTLPVDLSLEISKRFAPADHASGHDQIVQCLHCGLVYANPRMKREHVWQGYSDAVDANYATQAEERRATFERNLRLVQRYFPETGSVLDIGCAAGIFLDVAKKRGWNARGIEPNKGLAAWGRERYGVDIVSKDFLTEYEGSELFDVITFWDVLEHVTDPSAYLAKAYRFLKPGGFIFVNYPDIGSGVAKVFKEKWWFLSPVHLYYFNHATIQKMLEKNNFVVSWQGKHWQTLSFGYLAKRFGDYNKGLSNLGVKILRALHLDALPIRYFAGQVLAVAQKPRT